MIEIMLIGNLTADVRIFDTEGGRKWAAVNIAADRRGKNGDKATDFFRLLFGGYLAESAVMQYLKKGTKVYVRGEEAVIVKEREGGKTYVDRDVYVKDIQLLAGGEKKESAEKTKKAEDDCPFPL